MFCSLWEEKSFKQKSFSIKTQFGAGIFELYVPGLILGYGILHIK